MRSKGANLAITVIMWTLWVAIIVLLILLSVIIGKLVSIPPCTVIGQNACAVDGWTISGISANILAVGGTVLTVLAALAVTSWWVKLDDRIAIQVEEHVKDNMEEIRQKQEKELKGYVVQVLEKQKETIDQTLLQKDQEIQSLRMQIEVLQRKSSGQGIALLAGIIDHHDPWMLTNWAENIEFWSSDLFDEVAPRMVKSYLKVVDSFKDDPEKQKKLLKDKGILDQFNTPLEFWNSALRWAQKVKSQKQLGRIDAVEHEINQRKPFIEAWKNSHADN